MDKRGVGGDETRHPDVGAGAVEIHFVEGPLTGQRYRYANPDTVVIGRDAECHIRLTGDPCISRHHLLFDMRPPHAIVRDLGSRNGTGVLRQGDPTASTLKMSDAALLRDGDRIQLGKSVIVIQIGDKTGASDGSDKRGASSLPTVRGDAIAFPEPDSAWAHGLPSNQSQVLEFIGSKNYEVVRKLGEGGMGIVYLVRGKTDARHLAIKVLAPHAHVSQKSRELFLREVSALKSLTHSNIVAFFGSESDGRFLYLEMDYCNGGSVASLARRSGGTLPLEKTCSIIRAALEGLAHAHEKGLVHRDVKPNNILLHRSESGMHVRLCDFGLAKNYEDAGLSGVTATGQFGGTLHYMPRDQLLDYKYSRPPVDVWSTAATFYNLATGQYPRDCGDDDDPVRVVLEGPIVPIRERQLAVPESVASVIDQALNPDPRRRYASAHEFLEALNRAMA